MLCGDDAGSGGMEGSWLLVDLCRLRRVTECVELAQSVRVDEVKSRRAMRGTGIEIARYSTTILIEESDQNWRSIEKGNATYIWTVCWV